MVGETTTVVTMKMQGLFVKVTLSIRVVCVILIRAHGGRFCYMS